MTSLPVDPGFLAPEWCVALLREWASRDMTVGLGLRANPMWASARDEDEQAGERPELPALRAAIERLRCDSPELHAALLGTFKPNLRTLGFNSADLSSAVKLVAQWVDEAVGE